VSKGGKDATWADLKAGDKVSGTEKTADGKDWLVSLKATGTASSTSTKPATSTPKPAATTASTPAPSK